MKKIKLKVLACSFEITF